MSSVGATDFPAKDKEKDRNPVRSPLSSLCSPCLISSIFTTVERQLQRQIAHGPNSFRKPVESGNPATGPYSLGGLRFVPLQPRARETEKRKGIGKKGKNRKKVQLSCDPGDSRRLAFCKSTSAKASSARS